MKLDVVVPTRLSEIPLRTYQEWLTVQEKSNDEELLAHKFVQLFLGLSLKDAVQVARKDINRMISKITKALQETPEFKQTFKFRDIEFGFIPNLDNITWGEYIDIENNLMQWDTFHIALSVLYRPITRRVKDTYEIAPYTADESFHELFKMMPLDIAMSGSVFFYRLEKELLNNTMESLQKNVKKMKRTTQKGRNSQNNGDGITQYIDSLKGTLQDLTKLPSYPYINPLPFSHTKRKKIRSNTMSKSVE